MPLGSATWQLREIAPGGRHAHLWRVEHHSASWIDKKLSAETPFAERSQVLPHQPHKS